MCSSVGAVDENTTPVGADSTSDSSLNAGGSNDSGNDEDTTGSESFELDVTYDDGSAEDSDDEDVNHEGNEKVSINLEKHATGYPVFLVLIVLISSILPIVGRK